MADRPRRQRHRRHQLALLAAAGDLPLHSAASTSSASTHRHPHSHSHSHSHANSHTQPSQPPRNDSPSAASDDSWVPYGTPGVATAETVRLRYLHRDQAASGSCCSRLGRALLAPCSLLLSLLLVAAAGLAWAALASPAWLLTDSQRTTGGYSSAFSSADGGPQFQRLLTRLPCAVHKSFLSQLFHCLSCSSAVGES